MPKRSDPWSYKKKRKRQKKKKNNNDPPSSQSLTNEINGTSAPPLDEQDMHSELETPTIKQEHIVNSPAPQTLMLSTSLMPSFGLLPSQKSASIPIVIKEEAIVSNSVLEQSDLTKVQTGTENELVNEALKVGENELSENDKTKEVIADKTEVITSEEVDISNVKKENDIDKEIVDYTVPDQANLAIVKIESDFSIENTEEGKETEIFYCSTEKDNDIEIIEVVNKSNTAPGKTNVITVKREIDPEIEIIGSVKAKKRLLTVPVSNQDDDIILIGECILEKEPELSPSFFNLTSDDGAKLLSNENLCATAPSSPNENICQDESVTPEEKVFLEILKSSKGKALLHSTDNDSIQSVFYSRMTPNSDEQKEEVDNLDELSTYMDSCLNLDYDEIYNSIKLVEKLCIHLDDFKCQKQSVSESIENFSVPKIEHIRERNQLHSKIDTRDKLCKKSVVDYRNETGFALPRSVFAENTNVASSVSQFSNPEKAGFALPRSVFAENANVTFSVSQKENSFINHQNYQDQMSLDYSQNDSNLNAIRCFKQKRSHIELEDSEINKLQSVIPSLENELYKKSNSSEVLNNCTNSKVRACDNEGVRKMIKLEPLETNLTEQESAVTNLQKKLLNQPHHVDASHLQQKLNNRREVSQSSQKTILINAAKPNVESQGDEQCVHINIKTESSDSVAPVCESAILNPENTSINKQASHLYTSNHFQQGMCDVNEAQKKISTNPIDPQASMINSIIAILNTENNSINQPLIQGKTPSNTVEPQASTINSQFAILNSENTSINQPIIQRKTPTNLVEPQASMLNSQSAILNSENTSINPSMIHGKSPINPVDPQASMLNSQFSVLNSESNSINQPMIQRKTLTNSVEPQASMLNSQFAILNSESTSINQPMIRGKTPTNLVEPQASMLNSQFAILNSENTSINQPMIQRKTPINTVDPQSSMLNSQFAVLNSENISINQQMIQRKTPTNPVEPETSMLSSQLTQKDILTNHIHSESSLKNTKDEHLLRNKSLTEFDSEACLSQTSLASKSENFPCHLTSTNSERAAYISYPVYSMQSGSLSAKASDHFTPNFTHGDAVNFLNQTFTEMSAINSNKNLEQLWRNGDEISRNQSSQLNTKRKNRIDVREYLNRKKPMSNMENSHVIPQNIVDKESLSSASKNRLPSTGLSSWQQPSQDDHLSAKSSSNNRHLVNSFTLPLHPRLKGPSANSISRSNLLDFPGSNPWQVSPQVDDLTAQDMDIDSIDEFQHFDEQCRQRSLEASFPRPVEKSNTPSSFRPNNIGSRLCAPSMHYSGNQNFYPGLRSHEEVSRISKTPCGFNPIINYGVENINNHSSESRKPLNSMQSSVSDGETHPINVVINRSSGLLPSDSTNFSPSLGLNIQNSPIRQVPASFNENQSNNIVIKPSNIHSSSSNFPPIHPILPSVPSNNIEVIQNTVSSKRRQRSVSLIPQTLRDLIGHNYVTGSDLYLILIEFNIDWFSEYEKLNDPIQFPPPILPNKIELSQVKNNYKDEKEYYVIYFKLLFHECWCKMYISWKENKHDKPEYIGKIYEYEAKNEFNKYVIEYFVRANESEIFPKESCIVLLRFTTLKRESITMLGYVTSVMSRSFSPVYDKNNEAFQILRCPTDNMLKYKVTVYTVFKADDINIKEMVFTKKLLNVRKFLQQNDALNYVNKSELCKAIIAPLSSPHVFHFSMSALSDTASTMDPITKLVLNPDPVLALINTPLACPERMTAVSYLIEKIHESRPNSKVIICTKSENTLSRIGSELRKHKPVFICKEKIASLQKISLKKLVEKNLKASPGIELIGTEEKKLAQEKVFMNSKVILILLLGCHEQLHSLTKDLDVSCVILDEAHCCTEPESVVPLNYNVNKFILLGNQNCVCEGISPITSSYDYNRSLFNRAAL